MDGGVQRRCQRSVEFVTVGGFGGGVDTAVKSRDVVGRLTLRSVVTLGRRLALGCARGKLTDREWIYCRAITEAGWPSPVNQWP